MTFLMIMCASMLNTERKPKIKENYLHVAVGVIKDTDGRILISLRDDSAHQGGLWEFPGGKVEPGETVEQALKRELNEELGITVQQSNPLIKINHQYPDIKVLLDVWTVTQFAGTPWSVEGQKIAWVKPEQLTDYSFPEANYPIISAARLPAEYAILNAEDESELINDLNRILNNNIKLIQARIKGLSEAAVYNFYQLAAPLCKANRATLLFNSAVQGVDKIAADGIHLTAKDLLSTTKRPNGYAWVSASCHNLHELLHAEKLGLDFVVLAPVLATATHPDSIPLGWDNFKLLANLVNLPVFALGGMQREDRECAQLCGAQGIAGIRTFLVQE